MDISDRIKEIQVNLNELKSEVKSRKDKSIEDLLYELIDEVRELKNKTQFYPIWQYYPPVYVEPTAPSFPTITWNNSTSESLASSQTTADTFTT